MNKLRNSRGGVIIVIVLALALLFPVMVSALIDLSNIHRISKQLKMSVNASVKSASTRIDWAQVPFGTFEIDPIQAEATFVDIMNSNMGAPAAKLEGQTYYEYFSNENGRSLRYYMNVFNGRHEGVFEWFPSAGSVPKPVFDNDLAVQVDRPTVFAVATVEYKMMPVMGGRVVRISQFASAQLNKVTQNDESPTP